MDRKLQEESQKILDAAIADGSENSVQFCVYRDGECLVDVCAGWQDFARTRPVDTHTIFPIYSTSKGVPATALTRLIAQGKLSADTPVADLWPEFAKNGKEKTLIRHLLNHSSGLCQRFPEQQTYEQVADWPYMIKVIEESAPDWAPGTKTRYQSLTYGWVTAEIIQRVTGKSFRAYVEEELFGPEQIKDFYFGTTDEAERNAAEIRCEPGTESKRTISVCDPLDELMRQPCIRRAALPGFNGIASAHALAAFYDAILRERYFSRGALKEATTLKRPETVPPSLSDFGSFGYGFALSGSVDDIGNVFGHGGYGGSDGLADQSQRLAVGCTFGKLNGHPCKEDLYRLIHLVQREGWRP
jgi:CubicO group peptidase (beta-lactamase class C family)